MNYYRNDGMINFMDVIEKKFNKSLLFVRIGNFLILFSLIPRAFSDSMISTIFSILFAIVGIYFLSKYKCPYCKYMFDPRLKKSDLEYCPKCGGKLISK